MIAQAREKETRGGWGGRGVGGGRGELFSYFIWRGIWRGGTREGGVGRETGRERVAKTKSEKE